MKKEKKEKKKKEHSRRRWPIWLTILLTILGVGAISGVTVLGVYLAGGFDESEINPDGIYFSYDENLYNSETSQLEVTDNFTLMVNSSTTFVTNDEVTLSFQGVSNPDRRQEEGRWYISNGVIEVPETVRIREEIPVTLNTHALIEDGRTLAEEWIIGGVATLIATSEYNQISQSQPLRIAVDVPVWDIEITAINSSGQATDKIVTGESFTLQTRFIPAESEYLFSDGANDAIADKRIKHTYFVAEDSASSNAVRPRYDGQYSVTFLAGEDTVDSVVLRGYTFRNADLQKQIESQGETTSNEAFYTDMLGELRNVGDATAPSGETTISIGIASVDRFTVANQSISAYTNQSSKLYMNRYIYDENADFLGVNIYSTSGNLLEGMLENIAINFNYGGQDPTDDSFLQVSGGESVVIDGLTYYKPYSSVGNLNYSYWTLRSSREAEVTMTIVLLLEDEDGSYYIFDTSTPHTVTLQITDYEEEPLEWIAESDTIDIMLNYGDNGAITRQPLDLDSLIPEENRRRDHVFFAWFGDGDKADLRQEVDSVIDSTGYNYDLSGIYTTSQNILLFAIEGTSLTLFDSGTFRLYYAIIVTENGVPVYQTDLSGNSTYSIAAISQDYIVVNCEKELYQNSVSAGQVNTDNFTPLENGEYAINQGSTSTISFSFTIDNDAMPVFTDEFNSGYMSLVIRDTQNNDITSHFTVLDSQLTTDETTGNGLLTYQAIVSTGVNIDTLNGLYLSQAILRYDNMDGNLIEWNMPINDKTISIYAPKAQSIRVDTTNNEEFEDFINGTREVIVTQSLNTFGNFDTTIMAGERSVTSVEALLNLLLGNDNIYVIITDQKGRIDTLVDGWRFSFVEGSDSNAVNLNGQTFTFRQAENASVSLALQTIDGNATSLSGGQQIKFNVTSVGITYAESLTSQDPYPENAYPDEEYESSDISNLYVSMYGVQGEERITLSDLIKFYIGEDEDREQYENLRFQLSQQYLHDTRITDEMFISLFSSENGMISLYNEDGELIEGLPNNAQTIKTTLSGMEISAISFNKNFATDHIIRFSITDTGTNGAIDSTLNMTIRTAYTVTSENYPTDISEPLYAHTDLNLVNSVTNRYQEYLGSDNFVYSFESLFEGGDIYYIQSSGSGYILINESDYDDNATYIGTFDSSNGNINFYDFWDVESRNFAVTFTPEGSNYFTLSQVIQFTVTRDLGVRDLGSTYYVITGNSIYNVSDFVSFYRLSTGTTDLTGLTLNYSFDQFFNVSSSGDITKSDTATFLFDYNIKQLSSTLTINFASQSGENIFLAEVTVPIEVYSGSMQPGIAVEDYDIYQTISNLLTYQEDSTITAQTQKITSEAEDESTESEYIMVQEGTWNLNTTFVSGSGYSVYANMLDSEGNSLETYYDVYGGDDYLTYLTLNFRNTRNKILQGLDEKVYLVIFFGSPDDSGMPQFPGSVAVMYVPLIISSIGFDYVNYQEDMVSEELKLQTAITDPNSYIENGDYVGPYQTITAGQISQILSQYEFTDKTQTTGLYILGGEQLQASINYYPLNSTGSLTTSQEIVKFTRIDSVEVEGVAEQVGTISLNHLSDEYQSFYFAVKYTLTSTNDSRDFYYVYKVEPDVIVEDPVYAYNHNSDGAAEYLQDSEGQVDLNQIFGATTLAENQKRFNVTKQFNVVSAIDEVTLTESPLTEIEISVGSEDMQLWISVLNGDEVLYQLSSPYKVTKPESLENVVIDLKTIFGEDEVNIVAGNTINISILSGQGDIYYNGSLIFSDLVETNEIEYVKVGERIYYTEEEWSNYIDIYFTQNTSIMHYSYNTQSNEQITISIRHSYNGSANENELSVLGREQYYQFIINSTEYKYSVRFVNDGQSFTTDVNNQIYTWNNVDTSESDSINIYLLQGIDAGSSGYEEIWNNLHIAFTGERDLYGEDIASEDSAIDATQGFSYDSSSAGNGLFTIYFANYISSARILEFTLYTEQGYLASLNILVDATANFAIKEGASTELTGGDKYIFSDIFDIQLNDVSVNTDYYSITANVLSSTECQDFKGEDFVVFEEEDGVFVVANLLSDCKVNFSFTITFNSGAGSDFDGKTFTFVQEITLLANVNYNSSVGGGQVIAGQSKEISGIFNSISGLNTTIQYLGSSTSQAFVPEIIDNKISTNYVANVTNMDVRLTVRIYFTYGDSEINDTTPYQTFNMTYSLSVYPSVVITTHYPVPNGEEIDREYIDTASTYNDILSDFIMHSAIFSDDARLTFAPAKYNESGNVEYDYDNLLSSDDVREDLSILVYSQENASIYTDSYGDRTYYLASETIPADTSDIVFVRGTRVTSPDGDSFDDSMGSSHIRLRVTYQNVQVYYELYLLDNSISVQINNVNTASGQFSDGTSPVQVTYEISYIDKTNLSNNMFAKSRLADVVYSQTLSITGSYYLVFTDGEYYYASYSQYIESDNAGTTQKIDLGYSMTDKTSYVDYEYVGTYSVSNFERNSLTISVDGLITDQTLVAVTDKEKFGSNFDSNNAIFESINLTSRVQLIYGGTANIVVDYTKYSSILNNFQLNTITSSDIDSIKQVNVFNDTEFDKNDGSNNSTESFDVSYYYMPTIDVDIESDISTQHNYIVLQTNQVYSSMVSEFGVYHPSNDQLVNTSDFGLDKASLSLQVIGLDDVTDESTRELLNAYLIETNEDSFKVRTASGRDYLSISPMTYSGYIYDYVLLPLGADNQGDLVLVKVTYSVQLTGGRSASKDFYVVVKVIPDYIVSFGGNAIDYTEGNIEGNEISNIENIYNISDVLENYYQPFQLTKSTADDDGYVSVRHKNGGTDVTNVELATSNFTITMTVPGDVIGGVQYNDVDNVAQKLSTDLETWEYDGSAVSGTYTFASGTTTFSSAELVIFGTQYYKVEAVDDYGFKYVVYFSLQSVSNEPSVSSSNITLTENGYFDIGALYNLLRISTISQGASTYYSINNVPTEPSNTDGNVTLITINGIQAHIFAEDPTSYAGIRTNSMGGYTTDDDNIQVTWPSWNEYVSLGYFSVPIINYVTVDSISFYDSEDNIVADTINLSERSYTLATSSTTDGKTFNGFTDYMRDVYTSSTASLKMPKLKNTDLYSDSNTASVDMVIRLKYQYIDTVEYYDLIVPITVVRDVIVTSNTVAPVRDGVIFDVSNQFNISVSSGEIPTTSYINDTLEVLVNGNSTANFQLYLIRDGEQLGDGASVSLTNGNASARTQYISISQRLGRNVHIDDEIRIVPQDSNAEFYYITNSGIDVINNHYIVAVDDDGYLKTDASGNHFVVSYSNPASETAVNITIREIINDVIYVEDSSLLESGHYYRVTKYYVISLDDYTYRISKNYIVTGYFFTLQKAVPGDTLMYYLNRAEEGSTDFNTWAESFEMMIANANLTGVSSGVSKGEYLKYLNFTIDSTTVSGASGNATINEDGDIIYGDLFRDDEFLGIMVSMRVSGVDREIGTDDDSTLDLDILRLHVRIDG